MKVFVVVCLSLALSAAVVAGDDFIESFDVEKIMNDEAKMKVVNDCLLDRGPCGEFQKLREVGPGLLATDCANCSPKAKANFEMAKKLALEKYPKETELILKKYLSKS